MKTATDEQLEARKEECPWSHLPANECDLNFALPVDPEAFEDFKAHTSWHLENGVRQGLYSKEGEHYQITPYGAEFFDNLETSVREEPPDFSPIELDLGDAGRVAVWRAVYENGNLALQLICTSYDGQPPGWVPGEPFGRATVNLVDQPTPPPNQAYLDTNNIPEILDVLVKAGAGIDTGQKAESGWCKYPLFAFRQDWLESVPRLP